MTGAPEPRIPDMDLMAYADWPVLLDEEQVWCRAQGCEACAAAGEYGDRGVLLVGFAATTPREQLEAVKAHAEGRARPS